MIKGKVKSSNTELKDISAKVDKQLLDIKDPFSVDLIQQGVDVSIRMLDDMLSKKPTGLYSSSLKTLMKASNYLKDEFITEAKDGFIHKIEKSRARRHLTMIKTIMDEIAYCPTQDTFDRRYAIREARRVKAMSNTGIV